MANIQQPQEILNIFKTETSKVLDKKQPNNNVCGTGTVPDGEGGGAKSSKKQFQKQAKKKYITQKVASTLLALNSPLHKYYKRAYSCADVKIYNEKTNSLNSRYCGCKCCVVCCGIRTAKAIDKYEDVFQLGNLYMVTLTGQTVTGADLKERVETYQSILGSDRLIRKFKRLTGSNLNSIRSLEVTYTKGKFHPHYHIIVEGKNAAYLVQSLWVEYLTKEGIKVDIKGQDVRVADEDSAKELFKYITKFTDSKGKILEGKVLDTILQATKGVHTIQPTGKFYNYKPTINVEDVADVEGQGIDFEIRDDYFKWMEHDWIGTTTGMALSGYVPNWNDKNGILKKEDFTPQVASSMSTVSISQKFPVTIKKKAKKKIQIFAYRHLKTGNIFIQNPMNKNLYSKYESLADYTSYRIPKIVKKEDIKRRLTKIRLWV